jgi:hypothetical protein
MNQSIHSRTITLALLITLVMVCFGFWPRVAAQGVPGTYELSFCPGSILNVNQELILHAYVADSLGNPATAGSVSFQACSRGSIRSLGTDPQPSAACDIYGTAQWVSWEPPRRVAAGFCDLLDAYLQKLGMPAVFLGPSRIPGPSVFASRISDKGVESPTASASQKMPPSSPTLKCDCKRYQASQRNG